MNINNFKNYFDCWLTTNLFLSPRFLPIICQHVSSKSKEIRRHICEFLDQVISKFLFKSLTCEFKLTTNHLISAATFLAYSFPWETCGNPAGGKSYFGISFAYIWDHRQSRRGWVMLTQTQELLRERWVELITFHQWISCAGILGFRWSFQRPSRCSTQCPGAKLSEGSSGIYEFAERFVS